MAKKKAEGMRMAQSSVAEMINAIDGFSKRVFGNLSSLAKVNCV